LISDIFVTGAEGIVEKPGDPGDNRYVR
jgi:hypothetical protein